MQTVPGCFANRNPRSSYMDSRLELYSTKVPSQMGRILFASTSVAGLIGSLRVSWRVTYISQFCISECSKVIQLLPPAGSHMNPTQTLRDAKSLILTAYNTPKE